MKQKIKLSTYSVVLSALKLSILLALLYYNWDAWGIGLIGSIILLLCISALLYMPVSISVDEKELNINRPIRTKSIPLSEIESIKLCAPTMAEIRICGSGGWCGYWGWFKEPSIGKYFAYYGKASDCFLVTLKDGHKYLLGCREPQTIVNYVVPRITV